MRLIILVTFLVSPILSHLHVDYYSQFPHYRITSALITNETHPLQIDPTNIANVSAVTVIHVIDPPNQVIIEVFHPEIIRMFPNLEYIGMTNTGMKRIGINSFENCVNILGVYFDQNLIEEIPAGVFRNCSKLQYFTATNNSIARIDENAFEGLQALFWLNLSGNQISSIIAGFLRHTPAVEHVTLARNPILTINAAAFTPSLVTLSFEDCQIAQLYLDTFNDLPKLTALTLNRNPIEELPADVFTDLKNLTQIHLESTEIRRLNSDSFGRLENLTAIYLRYSKVDEIEPNFFDNFPNLQYSDFRDNLCANVEIQSGNFTVLNECYENYVAPQETSSTTEEPVDDGVKGLSVSGALIMMLAGLVSKLL